MRKLIARLLAALAARLDPPPPAAGPPAPPPAVGECYGDEFEESQVWTRPGTMAEMHAIMNFLCKHGYSPNDVFRMTPFQARMTARLLLPPGEWRHPGGP